MAGAVCDSDLITVGEPTKGRGAMSARIVNKGAQPYVVTGTRLLASYHGQRQSDAIDQTRLGHMRLPQMALRNDVNKSGICPMDPGSYIPQYITTPFPLHHCPTTTHVRTLTLTPLDYQ